MADEDDPIALVDDLAIFVDDVIVATPKDFGFYGKGKGEGEEPGRYAPLKSAASHTRFRADLSRVVSLMLAGRTSEARLGRVLDPLVTPRPARKPPARLQ